MHQTTISPENWPTALQSLLSYVKSSESVALLCHQNADPDATCSAFALQSLLHKLTPGTTIRIVCPEGISAPTKQLLENLGVTLPDEKLRGKVDLGILVDTNALDQLGPASETLLKSRVPIVVVDHHYPHPDTAKVASLMIVDESTAAAAEVVYRLIEVSGTRLGAQEATGLLAALFVETKHFLLAKRSTFEVAGQLVGAGAEPRRLTDLLSSPMGRSERVARLKAAGRSQVVLLGQWIVATSELGSYQSSAARGLLSLGAHVAMVAGETKDRVRVNMRSTEDFYTRSGVHLARDLSIPVGKKLGGVGGGHPTAAGLSASGQVQDVLEACLDLLKESLGLFQS